MDEVDTRRRGRAGGPSAGTLRKSQANVSCAHPCVYQYGSCTFGDECKFADVDGRICAKFLKGNCHWGDSCCWRHAEAAAVRSIRSRTGPRGSGEGKGQQPVPDDILRRRWHEQTQLSQQPADGLLLEPPGFEQQMPSFDQQMPGLDQQLRPIDMLQRIMQGGGHDVQSDLIHRPAHGPDPGMQMVAGLAERMRQLERRNEQRMAALERQLQQAELERVTERDFREQHLQQLFDRLAALQQRCRDLGLSDDAGPALGLHAASGLLGAASGGGLTLGSGLSGGGSLGAAAGVPTRGAAATVQQQLAAAAGVQPAAPQPRTAPRKQQSCARCGYTGADLKLCGGCKQIAFCGLECQRALWDTHGPVCTQIQNERAKRKEAEQRQQQQPAG
eukprot:TRINITY_DN596_c3_g1_i1.p1 TRINITY_DN596_c3_g1~~TRINITY_DN596_c3_g1_i1.p1  ORF type:complete len:436 (+),score=128.89 TRINITY_DN596_c3_g1_i1:145-1308(+)